jgi:hypothetical protein
MPRSQEFSMRDCVPLDVLKARLVALDGWLETQRAALEGQHHLDRPGGECAYWHAGYRQALRDTLDLMAADPPANSAGSASPSRPAAPDAGHCRSA